MTRFNLITLPENFRSARSICRAASKLISHNGEAKEIVPVRTEEGIVAVRVFENERLESNFVVSHIADLLAKPESDDGQEWKRPSCAILCRTNDEVERFADACLNEGFSVGTRKIGNAALPEDWEVLRKTISFFANPNSSYAALQFLKSIWKPERVEAARIGAIKAGKSINDHAVGFPSSPATDPTTVGRWLDKYTKVSLATTDWLVDRLKEMPSGLSMADIGMMLNEHESKGAEPDTNSEVEVLTVHSAKSREWDHCVVVGLNEGFWPRGNDSVQESRRVLYVAMTRARDSLLMTCALERWTKYNGRRSAEPSRFLSEIK